MKPRAVGRYTPNQPPEYSVRSRRHKMKVEGVPAIVRPRIHMGIKTETREGGPCVDEIVELRVELPGVHSEFSVRCAIADKLEALADFIRHHERPGQDLRGAVIHLGLIRK